MLAKHLSFLTQGWVNTLYGKGKNRGSQYGEGVKTSREGGLSVRFYVRRSMLVGYQDENNSWNCKGTVWKGQ